MVAIPPRGFDDPRRPFFGGPDGVGGRRVRIEASNPGRGPVPLERGVRVRAYAGGRAEEEPRAVEVEGTWVEVREILRRWREPRGRFFDVRLENGSALRLLCADEDFAWLRIVEP